MQLKPDMYLRLALKKVGAMCDTYTLQHSWYVRNTSYVHVIGYRGHLGKHARGSRSADD